MRPFFIDDWPRVKEDHDKISNKIIEVFDEFQRSKKKVKELSTIKSNDDNEDFPKGENLKEFSLLNETIIKRKSSKEIK